MIHYYISILFINCWRAEISKPKEANERNFMMRWLSKKARTDSASSLVLTQPVDGKDVSESALKMKNDKCSGAVADGADLESGSDCGDGSAFRLMSSSSCDNYSWIDKAYETWLKQPRRGTTYMAITTTRQLHVLTHRCH